MAMANCSGSADESNSVTEESVERNFRAFRLYLEKNIKASDLIAGYEFFTTEHRKTICQMNKLDPSGAIKEALDIVEGIDEPGKYVHFLQTLEVMEYPKLVSVLNGSLVPVNDVNRKMILLFARHVFRYLKPTNILPYLLSKSVITENDAQTIRNIEGNDSTGNAAIELMLLLPNRSKDWYMLFFEALVDGKHEDLADLIDRETKEKIVAKRQAGELISMSMGVSLQPRNVIEKEKIQVDQDIGGPASANNLDPPDQKFISLVSLSEMLEENNDNNKEYSLSDTGEKIRDKNDSKTKQRKTKDICQMNSLNFSKWDEISLPSAPRSPESNASEMRPNFGDETSPKLLYDRAPPKGSEVAHDIYQVSLENKHQVDDKVMKDKDLSASTKEDKMNNNRANIIDEGKRMQEKSHGEKSQKKRKMPQKT